MESNQKIQTLNPNKKDDCKTLLKMNKTLHEHFKFFINSHINSESIFIHDLLCLPAVPLIGKYNKNFYDFSHVFSLVTFEFNLRDYESNQYHGNFNIPKNLIEFLNKEVLNIESINFNCKYSDEVYKNLKTFKDIDNVKFYWITSLNSIEQGSDNIFNIVPHNFLFKEINFEHQKRIVKNYPICIFLDQLMKNNCYVEYYYNEAEEKNINKKTSINFNRLRMEFSSTHLSKNSISFSPNNLKLIINRSNDLISFYVIFIYNNSIHIFYNWFVNSYALYEKLDKIFSNSLNIFEIIQSIEGFNEDHKIQDCLEFIKLLFNHPN
jgi:hypothetical protein